ncbi:MAG: hypothetical protein EOM35_07475 [Negativicutes bacterium]|nr:hypothetical protein [Negativicutes bacterium]
MKKTNCKLGDTFKNWTVISDESSVKHGHTYVKAQCKCGKIEDKCLSDLRSGRTGSCRNCAARSRGPKVEIGDKHKNWTVIKGPKLFNRKWMKYEVQCDCGTTKWVQGNELVNPNSNFKCAKCAAKERGQIQAENNGKVGELNLARYTRLRRSAEKRGIKFEVSLEYLGNLFERQMHRCAITGDYIETIRNASLDRINSAEGYTKSNVQWTTYQANVSKHVMSMPELYKFCKKVLNYANQQPSTPLTKCEGSETSD